MEYEIQEAKLKLQRLKAEEARLRNEIEVAEAASISEKRKPLRDLAEKAHALLCRYNHTDGCSWGYEGNDWEGQSHKRWLEAIEKVVGASENGNLPEFLQSTIAQVEAFLEIVGKAKKECPNWRHIMLQIERF